MAVFNGVRFAFSDLLLLHVLVGCCSDFSILCYANRWKPLDLRNRCERKLMMLLRIPFVLLAVLLVPTSIVA